MDLGRRARRSWGRLRDTFELWLSKDPFQLAGAIAFYTVFSLAPLMIILVALAGMLLGEEAARGELVEQIRALVGTQAADAVEDAVAQARPETAGILPTLVGVGALLFGATTVFAQVQAGLNRLWDVTPQPSRSGILTFLRTRFLSLGLVLIIGFLLLVSFVLTLAVATVVRFASGWMPIPELVAWGVDLIVSLGVVTLLFALIFKVLPDVRLEWRDIWRGAVAAAVLFAAGQYLISFYLTRAAPESPYGAAGSLVLVLLWVYFSSLILLLGAAFTRITVKERDGVIEPKQTAVRVQTRVVAEAEHETEAEAPSGSPTSGSGP